VAPAVLLPLKPNPTILSVLKAVRNQAKRRFKANWPALVRIHPNLIGYQVSLFSGHLMFCSDRLFVEFRFSWASQSKRKKPDFSTYHMVLDGDVLRVCKDYIYPTTYGVYSSPRSQILISNPTIDMGRTIWKQVCDHVRGIDKRNQPNLISEQHP
jgi:hypothetical protein